MHNSTYIKRKHAHLSPFAFRLSFPHSLPHPPNPTHKMKESTTVANTNQPQVVSEMSKSFLQITCLFCLYSSQKSWTLLRTIITKINYTSGVNMPATRHGAFGVEVQPRFVLYYLLWSIRHWLWYNRIASWVRSHVSSVLVRSPFSTWYCQS